VQWRIGKKTQRVSSQLGQSLVEFALILPILLIVFLGVLDLGRSFYTYIALTNAAREAARYTAVNNIPASSAKVTQELGAVSGCVGGTVTFNGAGGGRGNPYTVTVTCQFQLITPFMSRIVGATATGNRITIRSNATFVID
jgi:Flp pilus assembly protein TadG